VPGDDEHRTRQAGAGFRNSFDAETPPAPGEAGAGGVGGGASRVFPLREAAQLTTLRRAHIVEFDDPEEALSFHFDPSSYEVNKKGDWVTDATSPVGGLPHLSFNGSSLTSVSVELLFNDIAPHRVRGRRSTRGSIDWLFERLSKTNTRSGRLRRRRASFNNRRVTPRSWLRRNTDQDVDNPPILVLYGLGSPFICVLTSARVTTLFQTTRAVQGTHLAGTPSEFVADDFDIGDPTRATVQIELLEYSGSAPVSETDGTEGAEGAE
jgi:hypothetical protein